MLQDRHSRRGTRRQGRCLPSAAHGPSWPEFRPDGPVVPLGRQQLFTPSSSAGPESGWEFTGRPMSSVAFFSVWPGHPPSWRRCLRAPGDLGPSPVSGARMVLGRAAEVVAPPKTATAESPSSELTPSGPEALVTRRVCHGATRPPGRRPGPGCQLAAGPVSSLLRILAASGCCMSLRMSSASRQAVHAASWAPLA
jgi:hypothetical protein